MKIQIRKSMFETNSSSTHALCISNKELDDRIPVDDNNNVVLTGGQFGWGVNIIVDAEMKANYVAVGIMNVLGKVDKHDFSKEIIDRHTNYKKMLEEVIKEETNCEKVIFDINFDWEKRNYSCIDHQSALEFQSALENKETLRNFIFCTKSKLIIDNDNH